jgi:hypothetical protein
VESDDAPDSCPANWKKSTAWPELSGAFQTRTMIESTLTYPSCRTEIKLTESLALAGDAASRFTTQSTSIRRWPSTSPNLGILAQRCRGLPRLLAPYDERFKKTGSPRLLA